MIMLVAGVLTGLYLLFRGCVILADGKNKRKGR